MKKTLTIANTVVLIVTIFVNYLSNTGLINGNTMATISNRYANYFTPAGYAFSIWGLIYLGLLSFIFYSWTTLSDNKNQVVTKIGWWFIVSCLANSMWVVAWLYNQLVVSVGLMALLFISLSIIVTSIEAGKDRNRSLKDRICVLWPFSIYFGWVTVASIANIAALLTKTGWNGWGLSGIVWAIIMLCTAGLINILVIQAKKLYPFALVGIWAVLAIAVANQTNNKNIVYTCVGVAILVAIFIASKALGNKTVKS